MEENEDLKKPFIDTLKDRIFGAILGSALGNTMGSIVENWSYEKIEKTYKKIEEPILLDRMAQEDDYQIALLFYKAYIKFQRNITPEDLAKIWQDEFDPGSNFFWCMRNALELLNQGISPRQSGIYNINTGSAIMAISPVGFFNLGDPPRAYADALDLAYMYQPKADSVCAAALAAGYAEALKPDSNVDSIIESILSHTIDEPIKFWDKNRKYENPKQSLIAGLNIAKEYGNDWCNAREALYKEVLQWHPIDPIEVLTLSVSLLKMTNGEFLEGVIAGTNIGRDADTIANILGGFGGIIHGINSIPKDWREAVEEFNPQLYRKFNRIAEDFSLLLRNRLLLQHSLIEQYLS